MKTDNQFAAHLETHAQTLAFAWAVQEGNFSAAAIAHGLSPSAISKLVARLEGRLGVRLFTRLPRKVELTAEGYVYHASIQPLLDAMANTQVTGEGLAGVASGVLRIHTMHTFARHQIVPWLGSFLDRHPKLTVEFQLAPQFVDLFERGIDLAIHSGRLRSSSRIARKVASSRWVICASPDYLARQGTPERADDLAQHRCLNFSFPGVWRDWPFRGQASGSIRASSRILSSQGDLLRDLALRGTGIARLAEFHVGADLRAGTLVEVLQSQARAEPEPIYMIYASRRHLSPRIAAFADALQAHLMIEPWSGA